MFENEAKKEFNASVIHSDAMEMAVREWNSIYAGSPSWVDKEDGIKTINFAKAISSETARLVTLDIDVNISGSARADLLQKQIDALYPRLREIVEKLCANGTIALKPNGSGVDYVTAENFLVSATDGNGNITGIIFFDYYNDGNKYYTRMEWHRFEENAYMISNRAYVSDSRDKIGKPVELTLTPTWGGLLPDVSISKSNGERLDKPLFAICKMPSANNIDASSPLGMSIFSEAIEELKDLDIAYSRNAGEIKDSQTIELVGDMMLNKPGTKISEKKSNLPHHVHMVSADANDYYQSIERQLHTEERIKGINQQLSFIGYKCGYSNGYFVFNEKSGMVTATQVESDDRRTIQLIKDIRDCLKFAMNDLIYAMDKYADLYSLSPAGAYEISYAFGDIVYSYEEDKARHWQYVQAGKFPLWRYYVKFEGYSEEEAKGIVKEARGEQKEPGLFSGEE